MPIDENALARACAHVEFKNGFNFLQQLVHNNAVDKGFYDNPDQNDGEKIALMHSELSEALEALRNDNPPDDKIPKFTGTEAELADTIIRIMDYAGWRDLDIAGAIVAKIKYNSTRPRKHGKEF